MQVSKFKTSLLPVLIVLNFYTEFLILLNVNLGGEFCLCFSRNADIHLGASETDKRNKEER